MRPSPADRRTNLGEARERLLRLVRNDPRPRLDPDELAGAVCQAAGVRFVHELRLEPGQVIIPAAGRGTRFGGGLPKAVAGGEVGRPLILRVLDVMAPFDDHPIVVVSRATGGAIVKAVEDDGRHAPRWVLQHQQRGMGDAVLAAAKAAGRRPRPLAIVWADMGALNERLVLLSAAVHRLLGGEMTLPTKWRAMPYIALRRDPSGGISDLNQRREGDRMPPSGESDCGVFWVRSPEVFQRLHDMARRAAGRRGTSELGFLPMVRDLAAEGNPAQAVRLAAPWESQGVNTVDELRRADACYGRLEMETGTALQRCASVEELLDVVASSTITERLWPTLARSCRHLELVDDDLCRLLPATKWRAVLATAERQRAEAAHRTGGAHRWREVPTS